jgi:iron complex transport system substrate-binding protein
MVAVPQRIVSLTPASTELLFALGAGGRLVGRTHWDVWPDSARFVPDMGDGIRPNLETILATRPDLVLLYASSDNRSSAERLRAAGVNTLSLKVDLPAQFARMTEILGILLNDTSVARAVTDSVTKSLDSVRELTRGATKKRVAWVADVDPLVVIGGGSFLSELITIAGGENVFASIREPSATLSLENIVKVNPEIVMASRSIIERIAANPSWKSLDAVRAGRILEGDSFLLGRPSVRMGEAARTLARLIHPELFR